MSDDPKLTATREELDVLARDIERARSDRDLARLDRLQKLYTDVVYRGRQVDAGEVLRELIYEYLREPGVDSQYPSLMEIATDLSTERGKGFNGDAHLAATVQVMWFMRMADIDLDQEWSIRRACEEAEMAAARYIEGSGEDRHR